MKNTILLSVFIILLNSISVAHTYTEISDGGWVSGMNISRPVFVDLDNDGSLDMIVGAWDGTIHHFEQDMPGSTTFHLISENFNGIAVGGFVAPCLADLDSDNLLDLLIGESSGNLHHYEQDTPSSTTFSLISNNFNGIDVGGYSAPSFTDLDNNGLLDLIIGEDEGDLHHYEQDAIDFNLFTLISDSLSGIDVGRNCTPQFTDLNNDGLLNLIVGNRDGSLYHYEQDAMGSNNFTLISDNFNEINVGGWSAPCFTDLDNDGMVDLIVGESNGNFYHYKQNAFGSTTFDSISTSFISGLLDVGQYSAPSFTDLDNNGLLDMIIGEYDGIFHHYQQDALGSNIFSLVSDNFNNINVGLFSTLFFIDLDNDNLLDLIVGEWSGNLNHYEQDAIGSTIFSLITDSFNDIDLGSGTTPHFTDLDNDGLLDLIVGELDGNLNHYEQGDADSYAFTLISESFSGIDVGRRSAPSFTDLDNDSLLDLIVGESSGELNHYEQDAAGGTSFTLITDQFAGISIADGSRPVFADINGDGLEDLIVGNTNGGVRYFQRNEVTAVEAEHVNPHTFKIFPNYPNPFNPSTTIQYSLPRSVNVNISIYNLLGHTIKVLENKFQHAGFHQVHWDGSDKHGRPVTSGIYICHIQAGEFSRSLKLMLIS
jgi:hypothetical protein